ncbi:MAG TPA: response regulator transcription factor [Planctomycetaceae bacterium]|nr:response regulator transcription factor [Planctomycetaceae bacterium]
MSATAKIVLIEDDREISSTITAVLENAGYQVLTAPNGIEGRNLIETHAPELVITDMMMPRMGGFPVLEYLSEKENPPKVIMITANDGSRHKAYAEMLGVCDYLRKPFAMDVLLETIDRVLSTEEQKPAPKGSAKLRRSSKKN